MNHIESQHNVNYHLDSGDHSPDIPNNSISTDAFPGENATHAELTIDEDRMDISGEGGDEMAHLNEFLTHGCRMHDSEDDWESIDSNADYMQGDEGVGSHQIASPAFERHSLEVPNHGRIRFIDIFIALAEHVGCTCHPVMPTRGTIAAEIASGDSSGMQTPSSVHVEPGSGNHSLECSVYLTPRTESPRILTAFAGEVFFQPTPAYYFTGPPIWLAPFDLSPVESDVSDNEA